MDMDLPILDVLDRAKSSDQLIQDMDLCDRDDWEKGIEFHAPGYLALEAAGQDADYDLCCLSLPAAVQSTKKQVTGRLDFVPGVTSFLDRHWCHTDQNTSNED